MASKPSYSDLEREIKRLTEKMRLIRRLELERDTLKTFNEQLKKETIFLRWSIAFALGIGFIVGTLARRYI